VTVSYDGPGRRVQVPAAPRGVRADLPPMLIDRAMSEAGADLTALSRQARANKLQVQQVEEFRREREEREAERARLAQERLDRQEALGVAPDLEVALTAELTEWEQGRGADPSGWARDVRTRLQGRLQEATQELRPGLAEAVRERLLPFVERASIQAIGQEATWQGVRSVETHVRAADALARLAAFREDSVPDALVELKANIEADPFIAKAAKRAMFEEQAGKVALAQVESLLSRHPEAAPALRRAVTGELSSARPFVTVPVGGRQVDVALGLLPPQKVVDVVERAQRELEVRAREAAVMERQAVAERLATLKVDVGDVLAAAEHGQPVARVPRERFAVLGERGEQAWQEFSRQYDFAVQRGAVRTKTGPELLAMLEATEPKAAADGTAPGFEAQAQQWQATRRAVAAELERRAAAPVAFAHEVSAPLRAATAAVEEARLAGDRQAVRDAARRRLDLLLETQEQYGLPLTVLDPGQRDRLAARLSGVDLLGAEPRERAAAQVAALDSVMDEYGDYAADVLRAVGRAAPAGTATQARLAARSPAVRLAVAEAWATPAEDLARALPASVRPTDLRLEAQEETRLFTRSLGARHGALETASETEESVERLAMVYAARGVSDPVSRAVADVIGDYAFEELAGRVVRLPAEQRQEQITRGLRDALAAERRRFPWLRDLAWLTLPDDSGVVLVSGDTPVLEDREPVTRSWLDLREAAATAAERAREISRDVYEQVYGSGAPLL
jgi:hypothetical protein